MLEIEFQSLVKIFHRSFVLPLRGFAIWISVHGRILISTDNSVHEFRRTFVDSTLLFPWAIFARSDRKRIDRDLEQLRFRFSAVE